MKKRLYCFPYAGGSASAIYTKWKHKVDPGIELVPVELPGRGMRFGEPAHQSIDEAVAAIYKEIASELPDRDYGLWGHSMGGHIAYELTKKIEDLGVHPPKAVIISGKKPLHLKRDKEAIHNLPDDEFVEEVMKLNGTDKGVFENKDLRDLFLPVLRNDFKCVHDYEFEMATGIIKSPIKAVLGSEEAITDLEKIRWQELTSNKCEIITLNGDHFFINENIEALSSIINTSLL